MIRLKPRKRIRKPRCIQTCGERVRGGGDVPDESVIAASPVRVCRPRRLNVRERLSPVIINGTRAVNSKKPTKFQIAFSEKYGDNFEPEKVKAFIEKQDKLNNSEASKEIVAIEGRWKIAEPIFIERVEKIFGISYPMPIITVYLIHNERCTYNIEQILFRQNRL